MIDTDFEQTGLSFQAFMKTPLINFLTPLPAAAIIKTMSTTLLDFDNQEKGFEKISVSNLKLKANIGKRICYVDFVEPYRGTYFVRHGTIVSTKRNALYLSDPEMEVDMRKIKECGIKIEKTQ